MAAFPASAPALERRPSGSAPRALEPAHAGQVSRQRAAHDQAPGRRRRHPDRGSAALSRSLPRSPGGTDERDVAAVRRDRRRHRRGGPARAAAARARYRRPAGRGAVPQHAGRAAPLAEHDRRGRLPRRRARLQRLAGRGVLPGVARPPGRTRRHPLDEPAGRAHRAPPLRTARAQGRQPRRVPQRQVVSHTRGRHVLGRRHRHADAADRSRRLRPARAARVPADLRVPRRRSGDRSRSSARASSWTGWRCRS